jgi:hypothetical protein
MRTRFIKPECKNRMVIRGPFTEDTVTVSKYIVSAGYKPATFIEYWKHVLFWWRKPKEKRVKPTQKKS